ncbi:MAG: 30S ribosomal protein S18 [Chloroflexi bacterium]|nr:30S ribosomal protein S18 [Chloroflexota bacterium]
MTPAPATAPAAARPSSGLRRRPGEFGTGGGGRKFTLRRKVCAFCVDKIKEVDYKDLARLRRFLSERGKIEPRRKTGTCAAHQRSLNIALKRARELALLPFTAEHIRVTGVLVREPGAPPYRGARPGREVTEPTEPAESANGTAAAPVPAPSPESPETVAEDSSAQGVQEAPTTGPTAQES